MFVLAVSGPRSGISLVSKSEQRGSIPRWPARAAVGQESVYTRAVPYKDPEQRRARHRVYMRTRWQTDPVFRDAQLKRVAANQHKYRKAVNALIEQFKQQGCLLCSERTMCCLAAHHLIPTEKSFAIAQSRNNGKSPRAVSEELKKCVCLCHNCHAKVHAGLLRIANRPRWPVILIR